MTPALLKHGCATGKPPLGGKVNILRGEGFFSPRIPLGN